MPVGMTAAYQNQEDTTITHIPRIKGTAYNSSNNKMCIYIE